MNDRLKVLRDLQFLSHYVQNYVLELDTRLSLLFETFPYKYYAVCIFNRAVVKLKSPLSSHFSVADLFIDSAVNVFTYQADCQIQCWKVISSGKGTL